MNLSSNNRLHPKSKHIPAKSPKNQPTSLNTHSTIQLIRALNSKKITDYYNILQTPQQPKNPPSKKPKIQSRDCVLPLSIQKPFKRMNSVRSQFKQPIQITQSASTSDQPSPISLSDFTVGEIIGKGSYGTVKFATFNQTGEPIAIKIYDKMKLLSSSRTKSVNREIQILRRMNHPNIVKFIARIDTPKYLYIAMEYVTGTSLSSYFKRRFNRKLQEREVKPIIQQMASGLAYCHQHNITHRDVKLQNVLITKNNHIKLIDFGFSTCFPVDKKSKIFCGTPKYMAPEIVGLKEFAGPPTDVWALGVLMYVLLVGSFPFRGVNQKELFKKIKSVRYEIPLFLSIEAVNLMREMIKQNPDNRVSMSMVLNSRWLRTF